MRSSPNLQPGSYEYVGSLYGQSLFRGHFHRNRSCQLCVVPTAKRLPVRFAARVSSLGTIVRATSIATFALVLFIAHSILCNAAAFAQSTTPPANPTPLSGFGYAPFATHPDKREIDALLEAGLGELARDICKEKRAVYPGDSDHHCQWAMLEMLCVAHLAASQPDIADNQSELAKALKECDSIAVSLQNTPRALWAKQRSIWCRWYIQRRAVASYLAVPARDALKTWSLSSIRQSLSDLDELDATLKNMDPASLAGDKSNKNNKGPTTRQLVDLTNDTILLRTDILLQRSYLYPAGNTERVAAATELLSTIERADGRISPDWSARPLLEISRATAYLQLGRPTDALKTLNALESSFNQDTDIKKPRTANRWTALLASCAARAARENGDLQLARTWIAKGGGADSSPDLALEEFATIVAEADLSKGDSDAILKRALTAKDEITRRFGNYWQQRADAILIAKSASIGTKSTTLNIDLLMAETKQLLAANRWQGAIEKLKQAEIVAAGNGDEAIAFELAMQCAAILEKNKQSPTAADEFYRAATTYPFQSKAHTACLMSAFLIRPSSKATPENNDTSARNGLYKERLENLLARWPSSASAQSASIWLDELYLSQDDVLSVLKNATKRIEAAANENPLQHTAPVFIQAVARVAFAFRLTRTPELDRFNVKESTLKEWIAARDELEAALLKACDPQALSFAKPLLTRLGPEFQWSIDPEPGKQGAPRLDKVWMSYLMVLATRPMEFNILKQEIDWQAEYGNDHLSITSIQWLHCELSFEDCLTSAGASDRVARLERFDEYRKALNRSESAKATSKQLGPQLASMFSRSMEIYELASLCWQKDSEPGYKRLEEKRKEHFNDPWWHYYCARLLQSIEGKQPVAIDHYLRLANSMPPGSDVWLACRARIAQIRHQTGETEKANELTRLVFASYPAAEPLWRPRFAPLRTTQSKVR